MLAGPSITPDTAMTCAPVPVDGTVVTTAVSTRAASTYLTNAQGTVTWSCTTGTTPGAHVAVSAQAADGASGQ